MAIKQPISTALILALLPAGVAIAAKSDTSTLPNGQPFTYLNQQITLNTSAIDTLQQQVESLTSDFTTLEQRVATNEAEITAALQQLYTLSGSVTELASSLHDLEQQLSGEIEALRSEIVGITDELNALSAQLTLQAAELTAKIGELEAAIASNSSSITSLSVSLNLLSSKVTVTESTISSLLVRITSSEQLLDSQQTMLDGLQAQLAAIDAEIALLANGAQASVPQGNQNEIVLNDSSDNDFSGTELRTLFAALSVGSSDYIYVEGAAPGTVDKFCSADAARYITAYANGQTGSQTFSYLERWVSRNGEGWSRTPDSYATSLALGTNGDSSGHGWHIYTPGTSLNTMFSTGFFPLRDNQYQKNEIYVYGDRGYPSSLKIRVGSRASACGF